MYNEKTHAQNNESAAAAQRRLSALARRQGLFPNDFPDIAAANTAVNNDTVKRGWFSLKLENFSPIVLGFELFNPASTFTIVKQTAFVAAGYDYTPGYSLAGSQLENVGTVVFDTFGHLEIFNNASALAGRVQFINVDVTTGTFVYCYRGLMDSFLYKNAIVRSVKVTSVSPLQLQNSLQFFTRDSQGQATFHTVQPSRYVTPEQTDKNIVTVPGVNKVVNAFVGINYKLNVGETVLIDFECEFINTVKGIL